MPVQTTRSSTGGFDLLGYQFYLYNFLHLRFQCIYQPHPVYGTRAFSSSMTPAAPIMRNSEKGGYSKIILNSGIILASNAKRYPLCENRRIPFTRNPPVSCLLGRCPNPLRTQKLCSGTMDKSIGCAILQIAYGRAAQRCSASFSRRSFASSCSLSSSRIRSILALAVSSSFISSRAFR